MLKWDGRLCFLISYWYYTKVFNYGNITIKAVEYTFCSFWFCSDLKALAVTTHHNSQPKNGGNFNVENYSSGRGRGGYSNKVEEEIMEE